MTDASGHLDHSASTAAGLLTMISDQLGKQLGHRAPRGRRPGPALVLVAHGSRDPRALTTVGELVERVREQRPGLDVRLAHIELNEPLVSEVLAGLPRGGRAVLVPLLLSRGYHVKRDLPDAAQAAGHLLTRVAEPLGPHALLVDVLHDRLREAGWRERGGGGVVLAASGSRDPEAAIDTRRTAALLARRLGVPVVPAYASGPGPDVAAAVRALTARGCRPTALASYFTAPGRFATEAAAAFPGDVVAAPLGAHPDLARLALHRYDSALLASAGTVRQPAVA
ncbi:sirohydrochlorin chelatase [Streptomyces kunmingensis]|uniref:Sirohydrochlorin chelatase n=1 Tax=Streptomyces kunmingensis TaxID=68225 RepID=A0ABU6CF49_9ACTN|nr:sirohydrochlorin chelatase [Streptomyces kunmingensis]MEB3963015.1 sirohydrochlorin chelatase [Streptomyces kunmingensis]